MDNVRTVWNYSSQDLNSCRIDLSLHALGGSGVPVVRNSTKCDGLDMISLSIPINNTWTCLDKFVWWTQSHRCCHVSSWKGPVNLAWPWRSAKLTLLQADWVGTSYTRANDQGVGYHELLDAKWRWDVRMSTALRFSMVLSIGRVQPEDNGYSQRSMGLVWFPMALIIYGPIRNGEDLEALRNFFALKHVFGTDCRIIIEWPALLDVCREAMVQNIEQLLAKQAVWIRVLRSGGKSKASINIKLLFHPLSFRW